jgi:hypothetical protein
MPIPIPDTYDAAQIDKFVGGVRLALPERFRHGLEQAVIDGLPALPPKSTRELINLVTAQVALTLRASNFNPLLDKEIEVEKFRIETEKKVSENLRFNALYVRHGEAIEAYEKVLFERRSSKKAIRAAYDKFGQHCRMMDDADALLLVNWAARIYDKAMKLREGGE